MLCISHTYHIIKFKQNISVQWGIPTFTLASILGMTAAILPSVFSSVGDYNACARIVGVDPPPSHAINRGMILFIIHY